MKKLSKLAKLAMLSDKDAENLQNDIDSVIKMAQVLQELEPAREYPCKEASLREDKSEKSFTAEAITANAHTVKDGFIIVPKVVE